MTVKITIESAEPVEVNGVSVPPSGEPVQPVDPTHVKQTFKELTGFQYGNHASGGHWYLPNLNPSQTWDWQWDIEKPIAQGSQGRISRDQDGGAHTLKLSDADGSTYTLKVSAPGPGTMTFYTAQDGGGRRFYASAFKPA